MVWLKSRKLEPSENTRVSWEKTPRSSPIRDESQTPRLATAAMPEAERRRRRPAVSCLLCRRRKIRCNRESPCSNCVRSKNTNCVYESHAPPVQRVDYAPAITIGFTSNVPEDPNVFPCVGVSGTDTGAALTVPSSSGPRSQASNSIHSSTLPSSPSVSDVAFMKNRIRELEEQLSKANQRPAPSPGPSLNSNIVTTTSHIAGTYHVTREALHGGPGHTITRGVMHKSRLFGQSHWAHAATLFKDIFEMIEPHVREESSRASLGLNKCKSLARVVKSRRAPPWPTSPTSELPPKGIADELVDGYLRTIETTYRVLHIPSFRSEYEALWIAGNTPDMSFIVLLKLVLAIGAAVYDDRFSMRASAVKWVYEAQTWVAEPEFKTRLNIRGLQTHVLLLFAREAASIGADLIWTGAGDLIRKAIYMGLHRDPSQLPKRTVVAAEMRRRLWNTILEITLQSSLTSGGPCAIDMDNFDALPPFNFDDDQLLADDPTPRPSDVFTQASTSILLHKTFPQRLAIVRFLNDLNSTRQYEECLRLDKELRETYRAVSRTLRAYQRDACPAPSPFEMHMLDFINHTYLSSVHMPFFAPSLEQALYAFSRKVVVESSLKVLRTAFPSSSIVSGRSGWEPVALDSDDLTRYTTCGSGFLRKVIMQSALFITVELRTQIQEEESLGSSPYRTDLLAMMNGVANWTWTCMQAGETNIKGYLFSCLIRTEVEGLLRGMGKDSIAQLLVETAVDAEERCIALFEEAIAQGQPAGAMTSPSQMLLNMPPIMMEDWGFIMSDAFFDFGNAEPMNWVNDEPR